MSRQGRQDAAEESIASRVCDPIGTKRASKPIAIHHPTGEAVEKARRPTGQGREGCAQIEHAKFTTERGTCRSVPAFATVKGA
jgi:hypothetical protein